MSKSKKYKPIKNKEWNRNKMTPYDTISFFEVLKKAKESMNIRVEYDCGFHYLRISVINPFKGGTEHFILTKLQEHGNKPESVCGHVVACARDAMKEIAKEEQQMVEQLKDNEELWNLFFFDDGERKAIAESEVTLQGQTRPERARMPAGASQSIG